MSDFFGEHPGRPDHPSFWKLVDVVLRADGAAEEEGEAGFFRIVSEAGIDPEVLAYMGHQRTARALQQLLPAFSDEAALNGAKNFIPIWMDGFVMGSLYAQKETEPMKECIDRLRSGWVNARKGMKGNTHWHRFDYGSGKWVSEPMTEAQRAVMERM